MNGFILSPSIFEVYASVLETVHFYRDFIRELPIVINRSCNKCAQGMKTKLATLKKLPTGRCEIRLHFSLFFFIKVGFFFNLQNVTLCLKCLSVV